MPMVKKQSYEHTTYDIIIYYYERICHKCDMILMVVMVVGCRVLECRRALELYYIYSRTDWIISEIEY